VQPGRRLALVLDAHRERARKTFGRFDDLLGLLAPDHALLRACRIWNWPCATFAWQPLRNRSAARSRDFQFAPADDGQGRRLDRPTPITRRAPRPSITVAVRVSDRL